MTAIETVSQRPARPEDEPMLYNLFAEDRAAQFAACGMGEAQFQPLIEMQLNFGIFSEQ